MGLFGPRPLRRPPEPAWSAQPQKLQSQPHPTLQTSVRLQPRDYRETPGVPNPRNDHETLWSVHTPHLEHRNYRDRETPVPGVPNPGDYRETFWSAQAGDPRTLTPVEWRCAPHGSSTILNRTRVLVRVRDPTSLTPVSGVTPFGWSTDLNRTLACCCVQ